MVCHECETPLEVGAGGMWWRDASVASRVSSIELRPRFGGPSPGICAGGVFVPSLFVSRSPVKEGTSSADIVDT